MVAQQLVNLFDAGLSVLNFHLVGHSLGAHVAGHAGRNMQLLSNHRYILPRISCLDPAGPNWYDDGDSYEPVVKNDALFVDVIHTDAELYGAPISTGTIDFWPNGGVGIQPGCPAVRSPIPLRTFPPDDPLCKYKIYIFYFICGFILRCLGLCSHQRSWKYWAESLVAKKNGLAPFLAVEANSWANCQSNDMFVIPMGINAPFG